MAAPVQLEPDAAYALWASTYPPRAHNPVMHAEERAMRALLPDDLHGRTVLDAGCGSGRYMLQALRRGASRVIGVDPSTPMLAHAGGALAACQHRPATGLVRGRVTALPVADGSADLVICGLVLGHVEDLHGALAELCRVTSRGGRVLCSDVHPIGHALGWVRDFRCHGRRYAVRHAQHLYSHWHDACAAAGLEIVQVREPMLDRDDIPSGARFDPAALEVPVALVLHLRHAR